MTGIAAGPVANPEQAGRLRSGECNPNAIGDLNSRPSCRRRNVRLLLNEVRLVGSGGYFSYDDGVTARPLHLGLSRTVAYLPPERGALAAGCIGVYGDELSLAPAYELAPLPATQRHSPGCRAGASAHL